MAELEEKNAMLIRNIGEHMAATQTCERRIAELERELGEAPTKEQYEELVRCIRERDADLIRRNGMIVDLHKHLSTIRSETIERCAKLLESMSTRDEIGAAAIRNLKD